AGRRAGARARRGDAPGTRSRRGDPPVSGGFLAFRCSGKRWAVPVEEVREAARVPALTPLPGAPPGCAGVALVRGNPMAVLRVDADSASAGRLVLVLENRPYALLVDAVDGVEATTDAALLPLDSLLAPEVR